MGKEVMKMIPKAKIPLFLILVLLTSCNRFASSPVINSTAIMETAISVANTEVIETQMAIPTGTPSPFLTLLPMETPIAATEIPEIHTPVPISVEGFSQSDPQTWVMIMPPVREYFYYRQKAVISNNLEELWGHYPELKNGVDVDKRINTEEFYVSINQGLKPFDGNFFPEYYERIRVKSTGDKAEVYVHGLELLLWTDENGNFQDSGGEIKIILFLRLKDNRWVVYKTDQIAQHEHNPFSP